MTDTTNTPAVAAPAVNSTASKPPRQKRPNYHIIHADPLPLQVVSLPPLIPHNPLSLLHILYVYLFPPASSYAHPSPLYIATFSRTTCSVNVTDSISIQGLWCRGFFGKGNLSRSEPTWLTRTKRKLGVIGANESLTAEELTDRRRVERREFKIERAKLEKEKLERILAEEGKLVVGDAEAGVIKVAEEEERSSTGAHTSSPLPNKTVQFSKEVDSRPSISNSQRPVVDVEDLEHLQLTLEEAFFLAFGLGVLRITDGSSDIDKQLTNHELFRLFRMYSYTPPKAVEALQPDDPFLVNYIVYHHFRALGWVVKPGVKFAVDYCEYSAFSLSTLLYTTHMMISIL